MPTVTRIGLTKSEGSIQKLRCAAYCRVSSSSEDQLHSYAAQLRYYREKFNGSETEELADIYADADLLQEASEEARRLADEDPALTGEGHEALHTMFEEYLADRFAELNL